MQDWSKTRYEVHKLTKTVPYANTRNMKNIFAYVFQDNIIVSKEGGGGGGGGVNNTNILYFTFCHWTCGTYPYYNNLRARGR